MTAATAQVSGTVSDETGATDGVTVVLSDGTNTWTTRSANVPAPEIARRYWNLPDSATLRDVVLVVRADEAHHRDVNHGFANELGGLPVEQAKIALDRLVAARAEVSKQRPDCIFIPAGQVSFASAASWVAVLPPTV